jgi:para-aminobenzoate synthetase component 1
MPLKPPYVLFRDDVAGVSRRFENALEVLAPETPEAFERAMLRLEEARADGLWSAGYLAYEAGYLLDPKLVPQLPGERRVPLMCMGIFDDGVEGPAEPASASTTNGPIYEARADWTFGDYAPRFERLHRHLREGDCYQGNLTFPVRAQWSGDPVTAFHALVARQPVRYGALVDLGGPLVLSRSPELFFSVDTEGWIETHPMKGTAPRDTMPEADLMRRDALREDPKSQAENRMIVDLLRNDVSRITEVGTLDVPELFRVETYPTVHQMVSRVRARLLPHLTVRDVFAALFPCGSITGAPKIRAMEVLKALEGVPRDVYCGAIGWIAPDGRMRFSVAIRTITLFPDGEAVYNVGGGIVYDSEVEAEYQECLLKARFATGSLPATG